MAVDMKEMIAEAARQLLMEKKVKRLTVKNIVEACGITRQAFYYHFAGIPELLRWVLDRESEQLIEKCRAQKDVEEGLRCFFVIAVNIMPHVRRSIESNYGKEVEQLIFQNIYMLFQRVANDVDDRGNCRDSFETDLIIRYHSYAVMGILKHWSDNSTDSLDRIVHDIYTIMKGEFALLPKTEVNKNTEV